jgi:hypothetical protein
VLAHTIGDALSSRTNEMPGINEQQPSTDASHFVLYDFPSPVLNSMATDTFPAATTTTNKEHAAPVYRDSEKNRPIDRHPRTAEWCPRRRSRRERIGRRRTYLAVPVVGRPSDPGRGAGERPRLG